MDPNATEGIDGDGGGASTRALFGWFDYAVFGGMLLVSALIGVYFGCFGTKQKTPREYLLGGKTMKVLPVGLSLVASYISGTTLIGVPAEVYTEGSLYIFMVPSLLLSCIFISIVFIPVFCNLNITSAFEYLELRFNRSARTFASSLYLLKAFLFLPAILYTPSLCMNQVTGVNLHLITFIVTFVCVFYTTIGGLKAVVWTDFFQTMVTIGACFAIVVIGTHQIGGLSHVFDIARDAGRLDVFNMDPNPFQRNTFWTVFIGTFVSWGSALISNQASIQRFVSVPTARDAQKCLFIYWLGVSFITAISIYGGLLMYAVYLGCDPIENKQVKRADQMYPFYVMEKVGYVPVLPGLFVAGVFSAALSTLSTSLNAIAATVYEDYIKQRNLTDGMSNLIMKSIVVALGSIAVIMVFVVERLGNIITVSYTIAGVCGAPIFSMFLMGMVFPFVNYKGALAGSLTCFLVLAWISVGAALNKVNHASTNLYPHVNNTCPSSNVTLIPDSYMNSTTSSPNREGEDEVFFIYRLSYMLYKTVGASLALAVGLSVSYFTGPTDPSTVDPKLLCPPIRRFVTKGKPPVQDEQAMDTFIKTRNSVDKGKIYL